MQMTSAAFLLADARFPAGGHAHSGGVEPAAALRSVASLESLELFLRGRLRTAGTTAAGLAAAACALATAGPPGEDGQPAAGARWQELDAEADARIPSPAQRAASRQQGRALARAARAAWPSAPWLPLAGRRPHHPLVLGGCAAQSGCGPGQAARLSAYAAVAGPASAAVRLLALDPVAVAAIVARLCGAVDQVAATAAGCAGGPPGGLPCPGSPALDLLAQAHQRAEVRLFES